MTHGMVAQLARLAGALRAHGVRVSLADEIDAGAALGFVDLLDRAEVQRALRIALKVQREAWAVFDRLFDVYFGLARSGASAASGPTHEQAMPRDHRGPPVWQWDGQRVTLRAPNDAQDAARDLLGYSPEPVLRRKPFERLAGAEIAAMERLIARLALRLAAKRSRRRVPTRGRGETDLRRSLRGALATGGELLEFAHRSRARDQPGIVVLYDTSGSMDAYGRFFLSFAFALRRAVRRVEIFAFNTTLVRVTRMLEPAAVAASLERLAAGVPDWSGGTRIGACLASFVAEHGGTLLDRATTVVVLSDGLDHGDTDILVRAMRELRARASRIVWLNPLLSDPRYRPEAAGMRAALPYVDHFGPAHNLESLEALTRLVARKAVHHNKGDNHDSGAIRLSPAQVA